MKIEVSEKQTMQKRAVLAAERFLERHDYEVLDTLTNEDGDAFVVAQDEETLVFARVSVAEDKGEGMPTYARSLLRSAFERIAMDWLATSEVLDVQIRFDCIDMVVIGGERALLRHHINAMGRDRDAE